MACCKPCCGCQNCAPGQEGKCCCGEACCQEGEFCCGGACSADPCSCGCCVVAGEVYQAAGNEAECDAVPVGFRYLCEKTFTTEGTCPEGWDQAGDICYQQSCVDTCDDCVLESPATDINCVADELYEYCPAPSTGGTWYDICPEPICQTYQYSGVPTTSGCGGGPYHQLTIYAPAGCSLPVIVTLTGSVDDDIAIDGVVIQPGEFTNESYTDCNPAHEVDYSFELNASSFTIAVYDNYGVNVSADLTICFTYEAPPP